MLGYDNNFIMYQKYVCVYINIYVHGVSNYMKKHQHKMRYVEIHTFYSTPAWSEMLS